MTKIIKNKEQAKKEKERLKKKIKEYENKIQSLNEYIFDIYKNEKIQTTKN